MIVNLMGMPPSFQDFGHYHQKKMKMNMMMAPSCHSSSDSFLCWENEIKMVDFKIIQSELTVGLTLRGAEEIV